MKLRTLLSTLLVAMLVVGCGSSKEQIGENLPDWYTSPPETTNEYMYAVAEAKSTRRGMARKQAMQNGRAAIATKLQAEVSAMQKSFAEEITSGQKSNYREVFTDVSKSVAQQTLSGVEIEEARFYRRNEGRQYEVIMLVRMPVGEAANALDKALSNTLSREKEMYTEFKESKAFKEMKKSLQDGKLPEGGGGGN